MGKEGRAGANIDFKQTTGCTKNDETNGMDAGAGVADLERPRIEFLGVRPLACKPHLDSLSVEGSTSHTSTDDHLVSEDGILHKAARAVA